jgi:PAS domain S-box-containing protein
MKGYSSMEKGKERIKELEKKVSILKTQVRHLTNDLCVTKEENESSTKNYFEIFSNVEKKVKERTAELRKVNKELRKEIAERKHAEKALQESQEKYKSFIENAPIGMYTLNMKGEFTYGNKKLLEMTGYKLEDWLNRRFHPIVHPDDLEYVLDRIKKRISGQGTTDPYEIRIINSSGEIMWVKISSESIYETNETGEKRPVGMQSFVEDITARKVAEESLRHSETKYRELIEKAIDAIYTIDMEGRFLEVNDAFLRETGYVLKEIIGNNWAFMLHTDDKPIVLEAIEKAQRGEPWAYEMRAKKRDGTFNWFSIINRPIIGENGTLVAIHGIARDITDRKQAEDALRESLQTSEDIVRAIPSGLFIYEYESPDRLILLDGNPESERLTGISVDDWRGREFHEIWPKAAETGNTDSFLSVMKTGETFETEDKYYKDDRLEGAFRIRAFAMPRKRLGVAFENITERKRAEEVLNREREKFRILVEESPFGVSLIGKDGHYKYLNPKVVEVLGYDRKDIPTGQEWFNKAYPDPKYRNQVISTWINDLKGSKVGECRPRVFTVKCKDGSEKTIHFRPVTMETGDQFVIYEDITEQKRFETQVRQAQKMQAIGTLAGGIAHDFNNILYSIMGNTEMAMDDVPEESLARNNMERVLKAAKRAKGLVQQILTFSRQSGPDRKPMRVQPILKEALQLLRSSLPTTIEILQDIDMKCGPILADPSQFHQIIMNLCTNAYHAMREKGGKIGVTLTNTNIATADQTPSLNLKAGPHLKLTVSDTGHGMDRDVLERIFEPFFTTKGPGEGTGMGLAVIHGIVKSYCGDILAYSKQSEGSKFDVYLPLIENGPVSIETATSDSAPKGKERILLVDDEQEIVRMVQQMLERLGYNVTMRTSSVEALEAFRTLQEKFDLVITDQTMPNMTGEELAKELIRIRPDIPIILCTGFSERISKEKTKAIGIREYIMKPILKSEMANAIRRVLDQGEREMNHARILIIDDDVEIRAMLRNILERTGYEVVDAPDGKVAMRLHRNEPADLIITDLIMPEKEGIETIIELKRDFPEVKIIAISGGGRSGAKDYLSIAQQMGAMRIFSKPIDRDDLLEAVRELLN